MRLTDKEARTGNLYIAVFMDLGNPIPTPIAVLDEKKKVSPEKFRKYAVKNDLLSYHRSYEWIMPVIEKIGKIRCDNPKPPIGEGEIVVDRFEIGRGSFYISAFKWTKKGWEIKSFINAYNPADAKMSTSDSYLEMLWRTVTEFLKWAKIKENA